MLHTGPAVVGFFPPRPTRMGDVVVFCAFAEALSKYVGPLQVLFPKERAYPSLLNPVEPLRYQPVSNGTPAAFSDETPCLVMPPSLTWLLNGVSAVRLRCLIG